MEDDSRALGDTPAHAYIKSKDAHGAIQGRRRHFLTRLACANIFAWLMISPSPAMAVCLPAAAHAVSVQGTVEVRRAGQPDWRPLMRGQRLCAGDSVRADSHARAGILLGGHTLMRVDQRTTLTFSPAAPITRTWLEVLKGALHFISRTPQDLEVETPFVNAAIEGTEFALRTKSESTTIWVYEGRVRAGNEFGSLSLSGGEAAVALKGDAPRPQVVLEPRDAVRWALYYPPLLDLRPFTAALDQAALAQAVELYHQGDVPAALTELDRVPDAERDARWFNFRAALLLSVGRVDAAQAAIQTARKRDPQIATPVAYEAIIALTQNRKLEAWRLAQRAVSIEPDSAVAHTTLSYVRQARFDLEGARASARRAAQLAPDDALARARLAELQLSAGDLDGALAAAQEATERDPELARTQTVLGFAYLSRVDTQQARSAFEKAIKHDQADPLPRLGQGLAMIREGNLKGGRREIEIATSLDPSQSIVRSYLGKAYFEERRSSLAGEQYAIAKELDPNDPTPWFYDAILKQTENRPVEALKDIQRSIELNDNRAVYRSRLLLDEDRATRGTSLARIYDDLGFDQPALVEASKSLSIDPSNHSAHRFLSDTYAGLPRHEIARVSELLQAQLLQPLNVNPVQPRLSVTDLNIIAGAGPAEAAFNEFTPLFERNRPQFVGSGIAGNNDTLGDEAVLSGLAGRLSYSLGQFHYETDGFRENNDLEHDIYNVFAQYAVTPDFNVQAELRSRETDNGDLALNFGSQNFALGDRTHIDRDTGRVGVHASISPRSDVIASLIHQDQITAQEFFFAHPDISGEQEQIDQNGYLAEAQYLYRAPRFNLVTGGGSYRIRAKREGALFLTDGTVMESPDMRFTLKQQNGYGYANVEYPERFSWTLGLSFDSFRDTQDGISLGEWSPKLGLQWNPNNDFRLRFAAFETLKRALIAGQTIEPTQIAGFNQFFDDANGTKARRYGVGVDGRLVERVYLGMEASERDLATPLIVPPGIVTEEDSTEDLYRAYLLWMLNNEWAVGVEYRYDKFKRMPAVRSQLPVLVKTESIPVSVRYFMPRGFFAQLSATHVRQTVDRELTFPGFGEGRESFELIDVALGFRDPKRRFILSLEGRNLLNEEFRFQDENFRTPETSNSPLIPDRTLFLRLTLSF